MTATLVLHSSDLFTATFVPHLPLPAHREDTWLIEYARKVAEAVGGPMSPDRLLQSLLAEGYSTLLELVPDCSELDDIDELESEVATEAAAQAAWCTEQSRWRSEAEELCAKRALSFVRCCTGDAVATTMPEGTRSTPATTAATQSGHAVRRPESGERRGASKSSVA